MIAYGGSAKSQNNSGYGYDYQSVGYRLDEEGIYEGAVLAVDAIIPMTDSIAIRVDSVHTVFELPTLIEFCFGLCARDDERDAILGDLIERYSAKQRMFGNRRAFLYACWEVFLLFYHFIKRAVSESRR